MWKASFSCLLCPQTTSLSCGFVKWNFTFLMLSHYASEPIHCVYKGLSTLLKFTLLVSVTSSIIVLILHLSVHHTRWRDCKPRSLPHLPMRLHANLAWRLPSWCFEYWRMGESANRCTIIRSAYTHFIKLYHAAHVTKNKTVVEPHVVCIHTCILPVILFACACMYTT